MASIVWRDDRKKWYAYFYRDGRQTGKPIHEAPRRKRLTRRERIHVQDVAEQLAEEFASVAIEDVDLETAAALYLQEAKVVKRFRTWERYRSTIQEFIDFCCPEGSRVLLRTLSAIEIRNYRDHRLESRAVSTVINDVKCLSAMFSWLRRQRNPVSRERWIEDNPCEDVEMPEREHRDKYFPSREEISALLTTLKAEGADPLFYALALFGAYAGMRRNEILLLHTQDVDLEARLLRVRGKSKHPRPIPMHPDIYQFLMDWPIEADQVFPSPYAATGQMRSPYAARKFNDWLRSHGFPFTHHALRRFFNESLRQHPELSSFARRLVVGHEDEDTNRIYSNPTAEEVRPFVEALGRPKVEHPGS